MRGSANKPGPDMRINRVSTPNSPAVRRGERSGPVRKGGFSDELAEQTSAASGVSSASPVQSVEALLSIQEVPDATSRRSRGLQRGHDILDELEELRRGLVLGALAPTQIERLRALAKRERARVDDPHLAEILNEIEIRAAVELAKLGL